MNADDDAEFEESKALRRYFLTRFAIVAAVVWIVSWPIQWLPHTVLWTLLATAALIVALISPHRPASSSSRPMHPR